MKNGKVPTREQKEIIRANGYVPKNWLVVKNLPEFLEIVSKAALKKETGKIRTRIISKKIKEGIYND